LAKYRVTRRALRGMYWRRINESLLEAAREARPDLVLAFKAPFMEPETIHQLRRDHGALVTNYYPDNPYCGVPWNPRKTSAQRRDLVDVLSHYDRVWTWEPGLASRLERDRVKASYLPFALDDQVFKPLAARGAECPECGQPHSVVFVGQHSDKRGAHVSAIKKHSVALWGARWSRESRAFANRHQIHSGSAFGSRCAQVYGGASISLNIVDDLNMPGHNMRTFEIPGSGGVMVAAYTKEQDDLFPEGMAAAYYREPGEIDAIISSLLDEPSTLDRMRTEAMRLAKAHTYVERSKAILRDCGIDK
jgi:spore maturation protein CgeB